MLEVLKEERERRKKRKRKIGKKRLSLPVPEIWLLFSPFPCLGLDKEDTGILVPKHNGLSEPWASPQHVQ